MTSKFNLIRRTCYFLNKSALKRSLYLSMVRSLVEHCNTVWSSIGKTQLASLERIQKRAVKWIRNEPLASYSNDQYVSHLNELNLLPFKEMFEYTDLRLFFKIVNDLTPIAIPTCISRVDAQSLRSTRQNEAIILGLDQTSYKDNTRWNIQSVIRDSFFHRVVILWNAVPYTVRQSESHFVFLRGVKNYLADNINSPDII